MKNFILILLSILVISCGDDDNDLVTINLDQANAAAPTLPTGNYEAGAKYTSSIMSKVSGYSLREIRFYIADLPQSLRVNLHEDSGSVPGPIIYTSAVTGAVNANDWNTHTLSESVILTGDAVWLTLSFALTQSQISLGCDDGPAVTNGDWIFDDAVGSWQTLRTATNNAVDINWNIRMAAEAP